MTPREKLMVLVSHEPLKKAEVIVLLEGDGFFRLPHAVELYLAGWAPKIVVSGGISDQAYGSFPAERIIPRLKKMGVAAGDIIAEDASRHTAEQARNIIKLAAEKKWQRIILVASHYHQFRAFLTFLKALKDSGLEMEIINSPARDLPWFKKNKWGRRVDLLDSELAKIEKYKNDVATFAQGVAYQERKEAKNYGN